MSKQTQPTPTLEQNIATALTAAEISSADLETLLAEAEAAIVAADATAAVEREKALDPLASPDATAALSSMQTAEFARDRLRNVLPKLQSRLAEVMTAEQWARWSADCDEVERQRDEMARRFADRCPKLLAELVELFYDAAAVDDECRRVNMASPSGAGRHL